MDTLHCDMDIEHGHAALACRMPENGHAKKMDVWWTSVKDKQNGRAAWPRQHGHAANQACRPKTYSFIPFFQRKAEFHAAYLSKTRRFSFSLNTRAAGSAQFHCAFSPKCSFSLHVFVVDGQDNAKTRSSEDIAKLNCPLSTTTQS
jgi:hypothetical protein